MSNESIVIDFQGGAHGNFLEFVCNVMARVRTVGSPFNSNGAAHTKIYIDKKIFQANHYSFLEGRLLPADISKVIAIKIAVDDLLPLSQISLLRAGDHKLDNNNLERNTYYKLNNKNYKWVLDEIKKSFFKGQIETSYNAVKDPSWPNVKTLDDFNNLPLFIKEECIQVHRLVLLELNETQPHCPREILREFFQIGFEQPSDHGFIARQKLMNYPPTASVFEFEFENFYNESKFLSAIKKISEWSEIECSNWDKIKDLHQEFIKRQPYKDSKVNSDKIVEDLIKHNASPPNVNLLEEAYINAKLKSMGYSPKY